MFDLLTVAESRFRELEPFSLTMKSNVKQHLLNEILMITDDLHFPDCHNVKAKIVRHFVGVR